MQQTSKFLPKALFVGVIVFLLNGCTSLQVSTLSFSEKVNHICIAENPKVSINNFGIILQRGLMRHGITSEIYRVLLPSHCEVYMTYTARRSWDIAPYLSHAEIEIYRKQKRLAKAVYHLRGKGGLNFSKWKSTTSKINSVLDKLLEQYKNRNPHEIQDSGRNLLQT